MNPQPQRIRDFLVPDLGEGLDEVTVTCWNVSVGDDVELNQTLCSVETAKAQVEIPSPYAGRIVEIGGAEGDVLVVGAMLVRIDTTPDRAMAAASVGDGEAGAPMLVGYGADADFDSSRRATRAPRPRAVPSARKLAKDSGVDLAALQRGPGDSGVITRAEVLAAAQVSGLDADVRPVRGVQARMAERMILSHKEIPGALASVQVDCSGLLRLSETLPGGRGGEVTPFVLSLRFVVIALTHHMILNSRWVDSAAGPQVNVYRRVHLGFAVATDRGLLVPVINDAQQLTTRELACRTAELISGAREGTLSPAELGGSTFTVSNFGSLGVDDGVPVINHPESAILGMGAIKARPVVVDNEIVARPTMTLTCVFDHRVADGAQVARFLCELRDLIESPATALLDL
ncbi:dihydrolipoamide acetyltransferase family protein [Mycobacterium gastri]|uniref:Dihydrolipoamide acetyltransferase component of pyruvate dehydrogenase complex n=1 Tax=Mycobacterium gastri TaxID=1777 RepID=A0A1X1V5R8_MYCGS|nr:dihydrolipoamide acetyltransferase family protein [Mycobacterium gastri]ETW21964.1 branched-chain alpha-keto acid dehydrogenase subunit E2 [Mycobacterium gastri 'Wayne']ORV64410.1 branched-chain alpha-keto acid dehydrogenase subunit E2 [Mycobacterium gastri]